MNSSPARRASRSSLVVVGFSAVVVAVACTACLSSEAAPEHVAYPDNPAVYVRGIAIHPNTPLSDGGAPTAFAVIPPLPSGLRFATDTGTITGTPTAIASTATYTVTASNPGGGITTALSITVKDLPPAGLSYQTNPAIYTKGTEITPDTLRTSGGAVVSCSVDPELPAGLTIDGATGTITGTPLALAPDRTFVVSCENSGGAATVEIDLGVIDVPPSHLRYEPNPAVYTKGTAVPELAPKCEGGEVTSYEVSPQLPPGLLMDSATGVIGGTPLQVSRESSHLITATNSGGRTSESWKVTVNDEPPADVVYSVNPATYPLDTPIAPNQPTSDGGTVLAWSVDPPLAEGLTLDAVTGAITGTPTAITALTVHTVSAVNSGGRATATLSIAVEEVPPTALSYSANPATYAKGSPIPPNRPTTRGGRAGSYTVTPALPQGLELNRVTGVISGTPLELAPEAEYALSAANAAGETGTIVKLSVKPCCTPVLGGVPWPETGAGPSAAASGDLNGDGAQDVVVANLAASTVSVLLNKGTGEFGPRTDFATGRNPYAIAVSDLSGDGRPDLAVANASGGDVSVLLNDGIAGFSSRMDYPTGDFPTSVAAGDLDGDGRPDLAVTNSASQTVSVLLNRGAGGFAPKVDYATGLSPWGAVVFDVNGDGSTDLVVANVRGGSLSVLLNNGDGTFAPRIDSQTFGNPDTPVAADLDGDGTTDLAVTSNDVVMVLLNPGTGAFPNRVHYTIPGGTHGGLAAGDVDGDGKPDLVVGSRWRNGSVTVLRNDGHGAFGRVGDFGTGLSTQPHALALRDLNGDGALDVAVPNSNGTLAILLNEGRRGFSSGSHYETGSRPYALAQGDLDGDGRKDLAVANSESGSVSVLLNLGTAFATRVNFAAGANPRGVAIGDLNRDGHADLAVANFGGGTVSVLLGNGNGAFASKVDYGAGAGPSSVAIADVSGDGHADLAVTNSSGSSVSLLLNTGNGTFSTKSDLSTGAAPYSVAAADFNADGWVDLAVANYSSRSVSVLLGSGAGQFEEKVDYSTGENPYSIAARDLNGDSLPDLAVPNFGSGTISVLLNAGSGTFAAKMDYDTGTQPYAVASGDLNGDGADDLAVTTYGHVVSVLLNDRSGAFSRRSIYGTGGNAMSVAIADFDGNGTMDLATANVSTNTVSILARKGCLP